MDRENVLILIKGSDKTNEIDSLSYRNKRYDIKFCNNSKTYQYQRNSVLFLSDPNLIDGADTIVYINEKHRGDVIKVLDFGSHVKVYFRSNATVYRKEEVRLCQSCLNDARARICFEYLKELSTYHRISDEVNDENVNLFLRRQYDSIAKLHEDSVLAMYLRKKTILKTPWNMPFIFPFGFNISQKRATETAFNNNASIIEGPPGTGKTQTIINIIANAVVAGKSLAIVSNNNSAVDNVQEKLRKEELDFVTAFLGNRANREQFFENQNHEYPDFNAWKLEGKVVSRLYKDIAAMQDRIAELLEKQNRCASLKNEKSSLITEKRYFDEQFVRKGSPKLRKFAFFKLNADQIISLLVQLEFVEGRKVLVHLLTRLEVLFKYGVYGFRTLMSDPKTTVLYLKKMYYDERLNSLNTNIEALETELKSENFNELLSGCRAKSMEYFKAKLYERYSNAIVRETFSIDDYKGRFSEFIKEYPVVLSTTHSLKNSIEENFLFDYVIIDEASQVDIVTGALAISCARNVVIVGDSKQLPQIVTRELRDICTESLRKSGLPNAYDYVKNSFLTSFINLFKESIPKTLLREHYRCHPKIIGFCNQKYYDNQLIVLTKQNEQDDVFSIHRTVPGNHERRIGRSIYNERQIDVVFDEILKTLSTKEQGGSIGIVSPYRLQADKIKGRLINTPHVDSDTVHKYQGRERDIMIMTTVVRRMNNFNNDPNLINVAVSRAVSKFIVVIADKFNCKHGSNVGDLIRYMKYNSRDEDIVSSNIISVFDLLYSDYSKVLSTTMRSLKYVSKYKSENLMNFVIERVLNMPEFNCFKHVLHVPLSSIVKDTSNLTFEEKRYASNIRTHVDFLIFNKMDKSPSLAMDKSLVVEVDGVAFHENNQEQTERDEKKNCILNKNNIPILRFKTNENDEEARLILRLREIKEKAGSILGVQ